MDTIAENIGTSMFVPVPYCDEYVRMRDRSNQKHRVMVAILDTGVDPGACGLTSCPDGSPKIVDVIDCTGSDDITVHKVEQSECSLPSDCFNVINRLFNKDDSNDDDIDIDADVCIYEGVRSLRSFVSDRSIKDLGENQKIAINTIILKVHVVTHKNYDAVVVDYDGDKNNLIYLTEFDKYDVFNDTFNPSRSKIPDNRSDRCRYGSIPIGDNLFMNFAFHLYNSTNTDEKICSLVFDTGSHATHIAGIVGGSFDDPRMNGVNPECQILSLKIGDSRVDGMETSIALIRALNEIVKKNCHIANYSYGEPISGRNGRFMDMLNEYIVKHNIIFVTSAGNSGPNITTVGAPGTISDKTINVAAYTDRSYLNSLYFTPDNGFDKGTYQWSSRGPSEYNGMGVDVMAPGCALTSHPRWNTSNFKMCNGTSMASPNAAGFISLIMSQFEDSSMYPHALWVKKYVESTCDPIVKVSELIGSIDETDPDSPTSVTCGHGLIGMKYTDVSYFRDASRCRGYYYDIAVDGDNNKKGIVSFMSKDSQGDEHFTVEVSLVKLPQTDSFKVNEALHELMLINDTGVDSVKCVSKIFVHPGSKPLRVSIPKNVAISGYIKMYEVDRTENEETYRYVQNIPINKIVYSTVSAIDGYKISRTELKPGEILRVYLRPTTNTLKLKFRTDTVIKTPIFIDVMRIYQGASYDDRSSSIKFMPSQTPAVREAEISVVPYTLTELCVYTGWSAADDQNIDILITETSIMVEDSYRKIFEPTEKLPFILSKYKDINFDNGYKLKEYMLVSQVATKYHPVKAEIVETDGRYVYSGDKKLKKLKLTYNVRRYNSARYYVNTNNKVYDSSVCMSACINGISNGRDVLFSNYKLKICTEPLDTVVIEIMDFDEELLKSKCDMVLTALRVIPKSIEVPISLYLGMNMLEIPKKLVNIDECFTGDIVVITVLNRQYHVLYTEPVKLLDTATKDYEKIKLDNVLNDFEYVRRFLNVAFTFITGEGLYNNSVDNLTDDNIDLVGKALALTNPEYCKLETVNLLIEMSDSLRSKYEYLGTLMFKIGENNERDCDRFKKRVKTTTEHLTERRVNNNHPYCVIDLVNMICDKPRDIDTIDKKFNLIDKIDRNTSWKNLNSTDTINLRKRLLELTDTAKDIDKEKKKRMLERKIELLEKTTEKIYF